MCTEVQTVGVLSGVNRGFNTVVGTFFNADMMDTECTFCGQCVSVCPTGALMEKDNTKRSLGCFSSKRKTCYGSNSSSC